ncbi:hypothetical protein B0H14DRAFT_3579540 [Mycena olivaceomarginata]|nr:hypothetical protein B0H14DRAFT_3579540 [Mycena olivaceomarginata]
MPHVVITDTDTRERGALQQVWTHIWLLLCKFHLRQCWTNKRKALKLVSTQDQNFWKDYIHGQLLSLEEQLIASTDFTAANQLISDQRSNLIALGQQGSDAEHVAQIATTYLDYLTNTWMSKPLWQSWSQHGRIVASQLLNVAVEGVLPTTNHLESFNGLLKNKYLPQWQRSGTRLRIDFLILILITKILPEIFALRRTLSDYKQWLRIRFPNGPGSGLDLARGKSSRRVQPSDGEGNLCWWPLDPNRQSEADAIVRLGRIYDIRQKTNLHQYEATCITSRGSLNDPNHLRYSNHIHRDGYAACTCRDFTSRGAACKHLRSLRLVLDHWVSRGLIGPFYYPPSVEAARNVRSFASTSSAPLPTSNGAAVLQNFLALQKISGEDSTANDDDEGISQEDVRLENGEDGNENNRPTVPSFPNLSQAAVATQIQQRAEHTAKSLLPRLHGLCVLLQNVKLTRAAPLTELHETLGNIQLNLTKALPPLPPPPLTIPPPALVRSSSPSISQPQPAYTSAGASVVGIKRPAAAVILAPSPEPHQRRKPSHSVL